ncbi:MAG: RHS repeat-associated core domain-containing protein [Pirellulaceae bacterium]|nr:RHS repeat-associated core domain-containing protein [Pirellulaceae bacterium]
MTASEMAARSGTPLDDGAKVITLHLLKNNTLVREIDLEFELDATAPSPASINLDLTSRRSPNNPALTNLSQVTIQGTAEPGQVISLAPLGTVVTVGGDGRFSFPGLPVADGLNPFTARIEDVAGNMAATSLSVTKVLPAPATGDTIELSEAGKWLDEHAFLIDLGQRKGSRRFSFDVTASFDKSDTDVLVGDLFQVYLVDPMNPGRTLLDRGREGEALFSLGETGANYLPGLVTFSGSTVTVDLTSLANDKQGLLVFQFINGDADDNSKATISRFVNAIDEAGVAAPVFSSNNLFAQPGEPVNLANYNLVNDGSIQAIVENIRVDGEAGTYVADLKLRNTGELVSRNLVARFNNLPTGVKLHNASGLDAGGKPYLNLRPAVLSGGLDFAATSTIIEFTIENANALRFELDIDVLSTGPNHAPVLKPISAQTMKAGGYLEIQLDATDTDGDQINYFIKSNQSLPHGSVKSGAGLLIFAPSPSDIGTYPIVVSASDGVMSSAQTFTLNVVADPTTTTRVSGKVLKVNGQPLANMPIEMGAVHGFTMPDGSFTLDLGSGPIVSDTLKVRGELFAGPLVYPFIAEKLDFILGHEVYANVNNVIIRPIYLPVLDVAGGTTIDPTRDTTVRQQVAPGEMAEIFVAAGSLMNQQGTPFTGVLSITEVPPGLTPASLPIGLSPDLVVTIQPGEMVFARPAPLTLPNRAGWGPGTVMDLWSINPVTGQFDDVGDAQVSADGKTVETISGGVRNSSWHFVVPVPIIPPKHIETYNPKLGCDACPVEKPLTSNVDLHSGTVIESHSLVSYQSQGADHGLRLVFDSLRADPRPIVHFGVDFVDPVALVPVPVLRKNLRLVARMVVDRGSFAMAVPGRKDQPDSGGFAGDRSGNVFGGDEHFWRILDEPSSAEAALQVDLRDQPSGVYRYDLRSGVYYFRDEQAAPGGVASISFTGTSKSTTGELVVVNSIDSPFGAGWGIGGLQYLIENEDRSVLLVDGDGSELLFTFNANENSFKSPEGDFSKLEKTGDGTYRRTLTDKTVFRFDSRLNLASITDRNNNVTQLTYNGQGHPTGTIDATGLATTFTYTGNRVTEINDPAGRTTRLSYDSNGNLMRVTDPDASARTWQYDSSHHMVGETDQLGRHEQTNYGFHGRAMGAIKKDGTTIRLDIPETQGLYPPDATTHFGNTVPVFSLPSDAEAMYVDGSGNVQRSELDAAGQPIRQFDAFGIAASVKRDANNLPVTISNASGSATTNKFDDRGNLLTTQDSLSVRLGDDPSVIGLLFGDLQLFGETDRYSFIGKAGERIWVDQIRGFASLAIQTPSGETLSTDRLPEDGTYQVTVGGSRGAYAAAIRSLSNSTEIPLGTPVTRTDEPGEDVIYRFNADRNQRFVLHDATSPLSGRWILIQPTATSIALYPFPGTADHEYLISQTGEHYLIHLANPSTTTDLQTLAFTTTLIDPVIVPKSGFGTTLSGTLQAGEEKRFSFSGIQGSFIDFDFFSTHGALSIELRDPQDRMLSSFYNNLYTVFQLPESGTYQVVVRNGSFSGSETFDFRVEDLASATTAQFDSVIQGTLTGGRAAIYRMQGTAGQRFVLETSQTNANFQLFFSGEAYSHQPDTDQIYTLSGSGDYYLIVEGSEDFSFSSVNLDRMPSVDLGEDIRGTFTANERKQYFRFFAKPDSSVYVQNLGISFITSAQILGEGGSYFDGLYNRFVTLTQSDPGNDELQEFLLIAKFSTDPDSVNFLPHSFGFRLIGPSESTTAITLGQTVTGRIELNEVDAYTFQGTKGQSLYLDWRTIETDPPSGYQWQLLGPDNQIIFSQENFSGDYGPFNLPSAGTYRLVVSNRAYNGLVVARPQDYAFRLFDVAGAPLVSLNSPLARQLVNGAAVNLFQLSASAGQRLRFEQTSSTTKLQIISPSGRLVMDSGTEATKFAAFSETGQHLVVISGRDAAIATPVSYEWLIAPANESPVASSGFDVVYQGTAGEGELIALFQGNAGSRILFRHRTTFLFSRAKVRIVGPSGEIVAETLSNIDAAFVLPRSGQYTARIFGLFDPLTAPEPFAFLLSEVSSLTQLVPGTTQSVPVMPIGFSALLTFEGTAGQQYLLDEILPDTYDNRFDQNPIFSATIESPDGTITPNSNFTPNKSGTYLVRTTLNSTDSLPVSIRLLSVDAAPKLQRDIAFTGTNAFRYEDVVRRIDVAAGEKLILKSKNTDWVIDGGVSAISWNRIEISSGTFEFEGLVEFSQAGTFAVVRQGQFNLPLSYSLLVSRFNEPVLPLVGGTLSRTTYTYDPVFSQPTSLTDEQGRRELFDIDPANGNVRSITLVVGTLGGADDLITMFTYIASGQVDTITDPLGRITDFDYDDKRRVVSTTSAKGTSLETIKRNEYDAAGNVSAIVDENGHRTLFQYDQLNRPTRITEPDPDGASPLTSPITQFAYDARSNLVEVTDSAGHVSQTIYDALDRVARVLDPGNNTSRYSYDEAGNLIRTTDPLGHVSQIGYDARRRPIASVDADGFETKYQYDIDNNVTSVTDAAGNSTRYLYDARSRRIAQFDPLGNITAYVFNGVNELVTKVDRLGRTTRLDYDDVGRLVREHWLNSQNVEVNLVNYTYDVAGRLVRVQDGTSDLQLTLDVLDRTTREQTGGVNGVPLSKLDFSFDAVGNLLALTDTINGVIGGKNEYTYDALDRLTRQTQSSAVGSTNPVAGKRVDIAYNALGQFTSLARFADLGGTQAVVTTSYSYDALSRLTNISHRNAANAVLNSFALAFDNASRITRITDIDGATDFTYDDRDQLTAAVHADPSNVDESYVYDATGNRISSQRHGSDYVVGDGVVGTPDNNQLTSDGKYRYEYDAEGSLTRRIQIADGSVREFSWDHRNRLIRVIDRPSAVGGPTQVVEYTYDMANRRIASKVDSTPADAVDGAITYFIYDGDEVLVEVTDPDGSGPAIAVESMRYLHGPLVDQVLAQEDAAGSVQWHLADHLGTIHDLVNNSGQVVNHLKYDSYGNVIAESHPEVTTRYRFTGREFDKETGQMYFRARYYDMQTGRFIAQDPVGFEAGNANFYAYVSNHPTRSRDPDGLEEQDATTTASQASANSEKAKVAAVNNSAVFRAGRYLKKNILDPLEQIGLAGQRGLAKLNAASKAVSDVLVSPLKFAGYFSARKDEFNKIDDRIRMLKLRLKLQSNYVTKRQQFPVS